jgi:hypothetical protein
MQRPCRAATNKKLFLKAMAMLSIDQGRLHIYAFQATPIAIPIATTPTKDLPMPPQLNP